MNIKKKILTWFVKVLPTKEDKKVDWLYLFAYIGVSVLTFVLIFLYFRLLALTK